jgi:CRISPR-associated endonuclease/helicase Cas3
MKISHLKLVEDKWYIQSNEEHCKNVSNLASEFATEFNCRTIGKVMGLFHDLGKNTVAFQNYISGNSGYDKRYINAPRVPHAYVGAIAVKILYPELFPVLSYCIMGHHGGLFDYDRFENTIKEILPKDLDVKYTKTEVLEPPMNLQGFDIHLWIRMLFSCLVDADFLDTESFMDNEQSNCRGNETSPMELLPMLEVYLKNLKQASSSSLVNDLREQVQLECLKASSLMPGFFSLTVPTGGGKTLSSLLWAIHHAIHYHKKRIIIAIPYTSIIVQTASILRSIFGPENVLEHHSNADYDTCQDPNIRGKMKLASENWDYPIIVTTNVQLFESLFANKPSKCRKLHNICNSVLILDEVQSLPIEYFRPILDSLRSLQQIFGVSVLFTTASQPAIQGEIRYGKKVRDCLAGIDTIHEIIPRPDQLSRQLRRTNIHIDDEISDYDSIAQRIANYPRVLCIVNTRHDAKEIYTRLPNDGLTYHLSRMMCPVHVQKTIEEIKYKLKSENEPIIRVVATQLIEAGVDIDFPVVFRQEAGLDSIIQAAGRCNREGKLTIGDTYVFKLNRPLPSGTISMAASAMNRLDKQSDWFDPETMKAYFVQLYNRIDSFDKANIERLLYRPIDFCFETAAKEFHLIQDTGINVIVCYENSLELVEQLKIEGPSYHLMKLLGKYTVSVREYDFRTLKSGGLVTEIISDVFVLQGTEQYDLKVGLITENHWLDELLIK